LYNVVGPDDLAPLNDLAPLFPPELIDQEVSVQRYRDPRAGARRLPAVIRIRMSHEPVAKVPSGKAGAVPTWRVDPCTEMSLYGDEHERR
jgi:hypothetical protein